MKYYESSPAVLLLEDGTYQFGSSAGKIGTVGGELCFNTGMTGYQEIFTDPSYYGQILIMTHVHIGNYGTKNDEVESGNIKINGMVCRNFSILYSRKNADAPVQDYFLDQNLISVSGIDTRSLVKHIRDKGSMNAIISSETTDLDQLRKRVNEIPPMSGLELASKVTTTKPFTQGDSGAPYRIAVLDLGVKKSILNKLLEKNFYLKVFPAQTPFEELDKWNPDGYFVSNGPGDPAAVEYAATNVKKMLNTRKPFFGICLGHQLFAIAMGLKTFKMHTGHRGINHPVKNLKTGRCEITTQNHGFAVDMDSIERNKSVAATHINLNDKSIEGLKATGQKAFSVQYHPEASPGPHDSRYLFEDFARMLNSD